MLDPRSKHRLMFWTDWGKFPRIERASMDGTQRRSIITSKLYWPNALTIDLHRERLYFADSHLDYIESCDYNGQKRVQIIGNDLLIHHPHSMAFFESMLYWVDRGHRQLIKMSRFDTKNKTVLTQLNQQALSMKIAHQLLQPYEENPCRNSNCEHLCLLGSSNSTQNSGGYSCACQIGYVQDKQNPNRCNLDETPFLLILNQNIIGGFRIYPNDSSPLDDTTSSPSSTNNEDQTYSELSREDSGDASILWSRITPVNGLLNGYDFAYDFRDQFLYWLEHNQSSSAFDLARVKFDGEERTAHFSHTSDYEGPGAFSIDFDHTSRNLYMTNYEQSQIEALNVDNKQRVVVYSSSTNDELGVGRPTRLALNLQEAELYWIDMGFDGVPRKIGAVKLDGSEPRIITKIDLNHPVSIFFHSLSRRVYFADQGRRKIESISIDNLNDRQVVVSDLEKPKSLTIWDYTQVSVEGPLTTSIMYYSDQVQETLTAFNLKTGEKRIIKNNVPDIMQIELYERPDTSLSGQGTGCLINNNGGCHQVCLNSKKASNGRICRCSNGLELQLSDGSCRPYQNFILFSTFNTIRAVPYLPSNQLGIEGQERIEALPILKSKSNRLGKFEFDYRTRSIFWIENENLVKMMTLNFSWASNPLLNNPSQTTTSFYGIKVMFELGSESGSFKSLAYDYVNSLIYYSYTDPPFNYIKATNYPNANHHYTIFASKIDMPSVLAINPKLKYLYWIDQGQYARLERSNLDGSNRALLISQDLISPTDLFVDVKTGHVYWSDNIKDRIERCDWDGKNRQIIKSQQMPNTKSIFVLDDLLYYADSSLKSIYAYNYTHSNGSQTRTIKRLSNDYQNSLNDILVFTERAQPLNDIQSPCSFNMNQCDQLCFAISSTNQPKCACALGELDSNNQRTCKTPQEYLIYSIENEIRSVNLPLNSQSSDFVVVSNNVPWKPIQGFKRVIGIDFDYRENKILFSDLEDERIGSINIGSLQVSDIIKNPPAVSSLNQSSFSFINFITGNNNLNRQQQRIIGKPEGISYDWVSDTIYYADNSLNQIVSYKLSTKMRLVLAYSESPRAIVVHPCKGYVYWTDVGRAPMIARTTLSGSNFEKIITMDIKWPNGLAIDFDDEKLYWADAFYDRIESSDLNGNYRRILTMAYHPFALTVHGHFIYWTDWRTNSIYRAEKYRGSNTIQLVQGKLFYVFLFHLSILTKLSSWPMFEHYFCDPKY